MYVLKLHFSTNSLNLDAHSHKAFIGYSVSFMLYTANFHEVVNFTKNPTSI